LEEFCQVVSKTMFCFIFYKSTTRELVRINNSYFAIDDVKVEGSFIGLKSKYNRFIYSKIEQYFLKPFMDAAFKDNAL
jgi:hypothetical protein